MDDEEDLKKLMEALKHSKMEPAENDIQYEDFIDCEGSDIEDDEDVISIEDDFIIPDFTKTDFSKLSSYDSRSCLKAEERVVIDLCTDPKLKNILILNRTKNIQLIQLYKRIKDLLLECQTNISIKQQVLKEHCNTQKKLHPNSIGVWRLAAPYFKDKDLYACPPNADTIKKKNNGELSIFDLTNTTKWSKFECDKLIRAVKLNYNINQQNEVMKQIKSIQDNGMLENTKENIEEKLRALNSRMKELKENDNSEVPSLNSDDNIDWMRVSDVFLHEKHSSFECRAFWHVYLHPDINKSVWTPRENDELKELAQKYKFQEWDLIAKELNTNRTGFTTCINYYSNIHDRCKKGEFTHEEDAKLFRLVHQYKMGQYIPWVKIVHHFKDRTRSQLHYRYTYYLSQSSKKKGKFTPAEDVLLMILVDRFGKNFKKCAGYLPTRSMVQCKARYNTNLQNYLKKGSFSITEDKIIMDFVEKNGEKSWASLTHILQRSRGQLRQRYFTIKQFLESQPNATIAQVPRRKHSKIREDDDFHILRLIADHYKNTVTIPTLEEIQKVVKVKCKNPSNVDQQDVEDEESDLEDRILHESDSSTNVSSIDDMLTNFFCNTFKITTTKNISSVYLQKAINDVESVLRLLKVTLEIPENFHENVYLDSLDIAILNSLLKFNSVKSESIGARVISYTEMENDISEVIPPNLNCIVGLRSLLIKYAHYKSEEKVEMIKFLNGLKRQHSISGLRYDLIEHLLNLPPHVKEKVEKDRKLFYKRFYALYKWPAVMTLQDPTPDLVSIASGSYLTNYCKRTYSGVNKNSYSGINKKNLSDNSSHHNDVKNSSSSVPAIKRLKITDLPSTSTMSAPLKLTPVTNKSVIEGLLNDKTKKLFSLNNIKYGNETKVIIKEIKLTHNNEGDLKMSNRKINMKGASTSASCSNELNIYGQNSPFNLEVEEISIEDVEEIDEKGSIRDDDSILNDSEDLKKLNNFILNERQCKERDNGDDNDHDDDDDLDPD